MADPLISVVMAAYNARRFLDEAVESICAQTLTDWELIVVDDCSTDGTFERFQWWNRKDARIWAFQTKKNRGPGEARDFALQHARGRYIAFLDSDDIAMPERLQKQFAFLQAHPDIIAVGSRAECIDEEGRKTGTKDFPLTPEKLYRLMYRFMPIQLQGVMIDRARLPERFDWFEGWRFSGDTLLFFKLTKYGKLANLPDYLFKYRQDSADVPPRILRQTFFEMHEARHRAVKELRYRARFSDRLITFLQYVAVRMLPSGFFLKKRSVFR